MLTQLDSGARAEEMLHVGVKARSLGALLPKSSFWCFASIAGLGLEEMLHVGVKALARGIVAQE